MKRRETSEVRSGQRPVNIDACASPIRAGAAAVTLRCRYDRRTPCRSQMFDGSSIAAGRRSIRHVPDARSRHRDDRPFFARTTMVIICDVLEPTTGRAPTTGSARQPRRPRRWSSRWASATPYSSDRKPSSLCSTTSATRPPPQHRLQAGFLGTADQFGYQYEGGNLGHRIRTRAAHFPVPPQDLGARLALNARRHGQDGRQGRKHHHEVLPPSTSSA